MSAAQPTRCRLNMQPPGLNIYASQSRTENSRSCRGQGRSVPTGAEPYRVSVSFGRITQDSFPRGRPVQSMTLR